MINKVQIIGKVIQRPEYFYTKDGIMIGEIIVQTYNSKFNTYDEFKVSLIGSQASASKIISCRENDLIYVEGRLSSSYKTRKSDGFKFLDHRVIVNSVRFWDDNLTHAKLTSDFGLSVFMLIGKVVRPLFFEVVNEKTIAKIGVETFIPAKPNPIVDYIEIALPRSFVDRGDPLNVGDLITLTGVLNGNAVQGHNTTYFNVRASAHNVEASSIVFDYPLDHSI